MNHYDQPAKIEVRGARVHNLKNINVDVPLHGITGIAGAHDELRKIFARTKDSKELGHKAGDFSYNTGSLRCPVCDGTGEISLDVQFLPDVDVPCPECRGSRYSKEAMKIRYKNKAGGEAQRLKLASEMGRAQDDSVFVFDEPTIGLHPKDVETLLKVFRTLIGHGATVIVIEHDLDVIRNADYIIDMGPGGGEDGGRIIASGSPEEVKRCPDSITAGFL